MITEYCPDGDLESLIKKKKRLSEEESYEYLAQIIFAVKYLHSKHIVHRDIKPENILLTGKKLKLIDFGLSNTYDPRARLKTPCGSPCFAPPEMVCGLDYDPSKSDIWSIGITLYYMVTGSLPFMDKELKSLYQKIVAGNIEYPEYLSENMKNLIGSMLCSNPKSRRTLNSLSEMPLLYSLADHREQNNDIHEDIIRSTAKVCKIPEALLREFIRAGNKNGFTAHYYLEVRQLDENHSETDKDNKIENNQEIDCDRIYRTPGQSARQIRDAHRLDTEESDIVDIDKLPEKQLFKVTIDTEFDGTMFYSRNVEHKENEKKKRNAKRSSNGKSKATRAERKTEDDRSAILACHIKDSVKKTDSSLEVKSIKVGPKSDLLKFILRRKGGVIDRASSKKSKSRSPGISLTQRYQGLNTIGSDGLKVKSRSPSYRKSSKNQKAKLKNNEIKQIHKLKIGAKIKSRVKYTGHSKLNKPQENQNKIQIDYLPGRMKRTSRSPNSSRTYRHQEQGLTPLDRIQNIFIKNSTLVNHVTSPKSQIALPIQFQALCKTQHSKLKHYNLQRLSSRSQKPNTSLFNLIDPASHRHLDYQTTRLASSSKSKKQTLSRLHISPGHSYAEKSSKNGSRSIRLDKSSRRQPGQTQNDSEYLMTPNLDRKKIRRGQKFKLQNKVFEILKNIVKE